jgi:hypothetical protein
MMHLPIPEQGRYLPLVVNDFYNYYAVPTNFRALNSLLAHHALWQHCLRRAQPAAPFDVPEDETDRGSLIVQLEPPAPLSRLALRPHDPRWEPGALAAHAGICAGAASSRRPYRDFDMSMGS